MSERVLIVGAGNMGVHYARVLKALGYQPDVVCRSAGTAQDFQNKTGLPACSGGLAAYLAKSGVLPRRAILAVDVDQLAIVTEEVIRNGIKEILLEKPGAINLEELERQGRLGKEAGVRIVIGYNRRFYASTQRAAEMIAEDGGVSSLFFDFTERSDLVANTPKTPAVKDAWVLANSSHVIDLAFFLAGFPVDLQSRVYGSLPWHPRAASFSGLGATAQGAIFVYHANWECPGRWAVDVRTKARRLLLCPLETLKVQQVSGFELCEESLIDTLDLDFKPGLYRQVKAFLTGHHKESLLSIEEQIEHIRRVHTPIANGNRNSSL